ncbi:dTDP-4-dehydrorhamnose reductase [Arachidicoccus ginsenosidimutans]|uniref:dTDP-4-dehydrorhamnose reductase n=1 Tax=Arachidicoccus sp. BS20 TaxID=1850526 RepID=UPI0007F108AB|nr:dTDP-4-dehydrorhamnose reductase [Arachidicoccus sp. BS20]ANI89254.1 dTDP-4-dehydrorhamnose reductase [Arachidicoccus sp. BS20]
MEQPIILVSGKNGQLGSELLSVFMSYPQFKFIFLGKEELDLSSEISINAAFQQYQPDYFINCGAYTLVDKAETERDLAEKINGINVGYIAELCNQYNTTLVHISTDYVFDGNAKIPYKADETTNPVNFYGQTKLLGEKLALENNEKTIIIRTAWVYSSFGKNFVKTMLRLMNERSEMSVVNDQLGTPTYAKDLAVVICKILASEKKQYGIYHFTNNGIISWFDFAVEIKKLAASTCTIHAIPTSAYPTPAKRPHYSVLDKSKIINDYSIEIKNWKDSLRECFKYMQPTA